MSVVGIDLGVHKIACVCITEGEQTADAYHVGPGPRDIQLLELGAFAHDFAMLHAADSVWVEEVIVGNNRKYSIGLAEVKGAVLSDLGQVRLHNGCDTRTVDNKHWKKELLGNGNAGKEEIRNYITEVHPVYAPLCGDDQDLYDACCIALYGLRILDRAARIQLQPGRLAGEDEPDPG